MKLKDLDEQQTNLFNSIRKKHLNCLGESKKAEFSDDQISKIRLNFKEKCFETHFKNGELVKYYAHGTWG